MPATNAFGLPYPLPTDPVADGATAILNLADAVGARLRIASGTLTVPVTDGVGGPVSVTFPANRFSQVPHTVVSSQDSWYNAISTAITTTGFSVNVRRLDPATVAPNIGVRWVAIQNW